MNGDRITCVSWRPFSVPLRSGFASSWGSTHVRHGLFVRVETADGAAGEGEASPLPGYAGGSVGEAAAALAAIGRWTVGRVPGDAWPCRAPVGDLPAGAAGAAICGFETAVADLLARERSEPLHLFLARRSAPSSSRQPVSLPVNALIDESTPEAVALAAGAARDAGYPAVKIKVGGDPEIDAARVVAARRGGGETLELRVDANAAWPVEKARAFFRAARGASLALCEEPLASGAGRLAAMKVLREEFQVPLAIDESCRGPSALDEACEAGAIDAVVVKPMVLGLSGALEVLSRAVARGTRCIVTTTFDAGWGTMAAAHVAALLPLPIPACGLATLERLSDPLVESAPAIRLGRLELPVVPGLGVGLCEEALARFENGLGGRIEA